MPRRRIPDTFLPRRPDRRRRGGNANGAQHRGRRGQREAIIERRPRSLALRIGGASYREIGERLDIDVHTAYADVQAELAALRERTVERAEEVRELELQRLDAMTTGLWPHIEAGNAPAVTAGVRVAERRSRLLGLDAPVATKTEFTGSLGVHAEKLEAERQALRELTLPQLEELAAQSQALIDKAIAMATENVRQARMPVRVFPAPAANTDVVTTGELPEQPASSPGSRAILSVAEGDGDEG